MDNSKDYPEDPLQMPPPFWEDSDALDQFIRSIEMVGLFLPKLAEEGDRISPVIDDYHSRKELAGTEYDPDYIEFGKISDDFMNLELAILSYTNLCTLMAGISIETLLNKFCIYNFHRDISEPLESLSPCDKLVIASALLGKHGTKSTAPYEATKQLTKKRNAFAHGHCVDHPTQSIRKNHLRDEGTGIQNAAKSTADLIVSTNWYLCVHDFLCSITKNSYVIEYDDEENTGKIKRLLSQIKQYQFSGIDEYFPYAIYKS